MLVLAAITPALVPVANADVSNLRFTFSVGDTAIGVGFVTAGGSPGQLAYGASLVRNANASMVSPLILSLTINGTAVASFNLTPIGSGQAAGTSVTQLPQGAHDLMVGMQILNGSAVLSVGQPTPQHIQVTPSSDTGGTNSSTMFPCTQPSVSSNGSNAVKFNLCNLAMSEAYGELDVDVRSGQVAVSGLIWPKANLSMSSSYTLVVTINGSNYIAAPVVVAPDGGGRINTTLSADVRGASSLLVSVKLVGISGASFASNPPQQMLTVVSTSGSGGFGLPSLPANTEFGVVVIGVAVVCVAAVVLMRRKA